MCTLRSFPHNISHCLTFARSEFEGLLEKSPAEANAFLTSPDKYLAAIRQVDFTVCKDGNISSLRIIATPPSTCPPSARCRALAWLDLQSMASQGIKLQGDGSATSQTSTWLPSGRWDI